MNLIEARNISVAIGGKHILHDLSMAGQKGELIGLIGPNGAGKSTLLKVLTGIIPYKGIVTVNGKDITGQNRKWAARKIAYLPQEPVIRWPVTGKRMVELGRLPHLDPWKRPGEADRQAIEQALADTDAAEFADREVTSLSGGERARIMLARTFATAAPVILADEPVAALDPFHQLHTMELLRSKSQAGCCVIVILQDLVLAARFCDRLILMKDGTVLAEGSPDAVLNDQHLKSAYQVRAIPVSEDGEDAVLPWRRII